MGSFAMNLLLVLLTLEVEVGFFGRIMIFFLSMDHLTNKVVFANIRCHGIMEHLVSIKRLCLVTIGYVGKC